MTNYDAMEVFCYWFKLFRGLNHVRDLSLIIFSNDLTEICGIVNRRTMEYVKKKNVNARKQIVLGPIRICTRVPF